MNIVGRMVPRGHVLIAIAAAVLLAASSLELETWLTERSAGDGRLHRSLAVARARNEAVQMLFQGERSIPETIDRFRELADEDPFDIVEFLRRCHGDLPEEELFERQVFSYAQVHTRDMADDRGVVDELRRRVESRRRLPRSFTIPMMPRF
ncbi:hypothetical protein AYO40_00895 [Planctomycetaceae bacterium SCGC AG-212-D15]|nr:hypothetical protein AYO40_00895 [Planctomycetaceae bacterium SCGC AG-212-D15]